MRRRDSRKVLKKRVHLLPVEMFEQSHALTRFCPVLGGKGGNGFPSANSVTADLGGKGGNGFPSATSVLASVESSFGENGGLGQPSAYSVRLTVPGLPAERLTKRTTGGTIKPEKSEAVTASAVCFIGEPSRSAP